MYRYWLSLAIGVATLSGALWAISDAQVVPQPGPPTPIACAYNTSPATLTSGQAGWVQCNSSGAVTTAASITAATTGGCTPAKTLSAASTNATSVKASAGTLCSLNLINTTATLYYLKLYDKATAATCNSDTVLQTIPVPASTTGAGIAVNLGPFGTAFTLGITFCLTGGIADNDNTNAATGVAINYSYK